MTDIADRPAVTAPSIGQSVRRKEDGRLLTGTTNWTDNIQLPGTLHMQIVRSPYAHAKITRIDFTAALAMPGVVAAFSAAELGDDNAKVICVWPVVEDIVMPDFPALAVGEVRHVGDCVAVRAGHRALPGRRRGGGDRGRLRAVARRRRHGSRPGRRVAAGPRVRRHQPLLHHALPCGDYEKAAADADVVVKRRFVNQRLIPSPMETRAVVASPMGTSGELTIWTSTQIPHVCGC